MKAKKHIKVASLNLWRFNEWERRLPLIVETIRRINPDIVLLQEVQRDISKDERNQLEILNSNLKFPYTQFSLADIKTTRKGSPLPYPVEHGLGILSKFQFSTQVFNLAKSNGDKEQRILQINKFPTLDNINIVNVHFSNTDEWAESHIRETLGELRADNYIIAGDFNIKDILRYENLFGEQLVASSSEHNYVSYPADGLSYDYILISKKFKFGDFECRDEPVSDHRMIVSNIEL